MYEHSMELLKRARKARFFGIFGFVPVGLREEILKWQKVLYKWHEEFKKYELEVCPVVSDRKEYIIKGYYLGYYAEHTFGRLDSLLNTLSLGCFRLYPSYDENTEGCNRRFTDIETCLLDDNIRFLGRTMVDPRFIGLLNKFTSLFIRMM